MAHSPFPSWYCAQIGAREHYAVPRALHRAGQLAALDTDFWAGPITRHVLSRAGPLATLAGRFHPGLETAPVYHQNLRFLAGEGGTRWRSEASEDPYRRHIKEGKIFASRVRDRLRQQKFPAGSVFFAYDTGALEAMEFLREQGVCCVLDQMDPNRVEIDLVQAEENRWPGWALQPTRLPEDYFQRRAQEWNLADRVVVNSIFSKSALLEQGVPSEKVVIIPLCYDAVERPDDVGALISAPAAGPLRVLFLGQVILRKGIPYLMEAARRLHSENIHFDVVGPVGITEDALRSAPANVTFHGRVNRRDAARWYARSHLFVLPTLSDGFALTQLEAMAHGLPVVATTSCGEVITSGTDGFLVPSRDVEALVSAISHYASDRTLLATHQAAARRKATQFTLDRLSQNLALLATELRTTQP